jgi:hypothetical protein
MPTHQTDHSRRKSTAHFAAKVASNQFTSTAKRRATQVNFIIPAVTGTDFAFLMRACVSAEPCQTERARQESV